jgi:replication factor C small subunit
MKDKEFLWVEKYRPQTVEDCVLPERIKKIFREQVKTGKVLNMILTGPPGIGKTTVAIALCKEIGLTYSKINASRDRGIDVLRNHIQNFASTVSLTGGYKVQILDEADNLTEDMQKAFRGAIEDFSNNCKFILTSNYESNFIEPLISRCLLVDFTFEKTEKTEVATAFFKSVINILNKEEVAYQKDIVARVIKENFPDFRKTLIVLQACAQASGNNAINTESYIKNRTVDVGSLMEMVKTKDFDGVRAWLVDNMPNDPKKLFRSVYEALRAYVDEGSIPTAVLVTAKYQDMSTRAVDQEINAAAYLTELMLECEFK